MSNFISFKILALEVDNTTTIKDSKICIENEKIGQCSTTSKDGIAEFIVKESEKLNPFKVKIVDKEYKEFPVHSRELIANSLRDHTQELRFERKIPIKLKFDGEYLSIVERDIVIYRFQAVSGKAEKKSIPINNNQSNKSKSKYSIFRVFTYEKEKQALKNEGPIPEGEYFITPFSKNINNSIQKYKDIPIHHKIAGYINLGTWGNTYAWGETRIPIQPKSITIIDNNGKKIKRNNFFIHGGGEVGSAGCIDLWKNNDNFFDKLVLVLRKYYIPNENSEIKIKLEVKYRENLTVECDNDWYTKNCKSKY